MHYVVTLIHGTFAKDATWTHEGSLLRIALEKRLSGPVTFRQVTWSGRNTQKARREGTEELMKELRRQMIDPEALLFVVAHSHGGNLAMYAMRDPDIRSRLAGLVTIATPFIVVSRRLCVYWDRSFLLGGLGVYAAALSYLLWLGLNTHFPLVSLLVASTLAVLCFAALLSLAVIALHVLERQSYTIEEELKLPTATESQLLILRNAGDEASIALLFSQFLALVPYRVFASGVGIVNRLQASRAWTGGIVAQVAVLATGMVIGPLMIAAWVSQIALNFDLFGNSPFLDVTAEATPPGRWSTRLFVKDRISIPHAATVMIRAERLQLNQRDPVDGVDESSDLIHSHLYTSWEALCAIGDWIETRTQQMSIGPGVGDGKA